MDLNIPFDRLERAAQATGAALAARGWALTTAESCTGGLVSAAVTSISGSSGWFDRGFVTYSNTAKTSLLGVPTELIDRVGAVSMEVAQAMAEGALQHAQADVAVSITGIAGPTGGSADKPVGTVWFGLAWRADGHVQSQTRHALFAGDRTAVRTQSALLALEWVGSLAA